MKDEQFDPRELYKLDQEKEYTLIIPELLGLDERNVQIHNRQLKVGIEKYVIAHVLYWIFLLFKKDYKKCIAFRKKLLKK